MSAYTSRLRVFGLFSGGASSILGLLEGPQLQKKYDIVGAATDKHDASGITKIGNYGVPVLTFDYQEFCQEHGHDPAARDTRRAYHDQLMREIEGITTTKPDVIALSGYFQIVPANFLKEHPRTLNVHPAPLHYLTQRVYRDQRASYQNLIPVGHMLPSEAEEAFPAEKFTRAFTGEAPVKDMLLFGPEHDVLEFRSTVHFATPKPDEGPILVESGRVPVDEERVGRLIRNRSWDKLDALAKQHQEQMKGKADVPAFQAAIELIADGVVMYEFGECEVRVKDRMLPYHGIQLPD
ncbi:MAG: hypothetical protein HY369_01095 [Candidatus Aenigmarchaeota archaeon]|nr:hypothetical protein [Candidatus Aenigmarchaeota archaeon]